MSSCSRRFSLTTICLAVLLLVGCASSPRFTQSDRARKSPSPTANPTPSTPPVSGRSLLTLEGLASYYAHDFHGRKTSNGEIYNMHDLTAAHRNFPFGTKIKVTNLGNDRTIVVRVNDRGPFHADRIIDLSLGAAKELGFEKEGTAKVRLEVVEWGDGR